jgi:hypothetical protein
VRAVGRDCFVVRLMSGDWGRSGDRNHIKEGLWWLQRQRSFIDVVDRDHF